MKFLLATVVLLGFLALVVQAKSKPEPAKGFRSSYQSPKFRSAASDVKIDKIAKLRQTEAAEADDEKGGRVIWINFTPFTNLFNSSNAQPVVLSEVLEDNDNADASEGAIGLGGQILQAALADGTPEYVATDEEIKGTSDGKTSEQPAPTSLNQGNMKGQNIRERIPPRYRQNIRNGQRVILNNRNRRVIRNRKRFNRNNNSYIRERID